jgi:hypothetical protein
VGAYVTTMVVYYWSSAHTLFLGGKGIKLDYDVLWRFLEGNPLAKLQFPSDPYQL